jgi:CelD/BcsL family acetyltransferase involved in cellulose biosynthesis
MRRLISSEPQMAQVHANVVRSYEAARAMRDEWLRLWRTIPVATPFQSPDWLLNWWKYFGHGSALFIVTVQLDGSLIALVPLCIGANEDNIRVLRLVGTGISDYLDGLFAPAFQQVAMAQLSAALHECRSEWDQCELEELRRFSPLTSMLLPASRHDELHEQSVCPFVPLAGDDPARQIGRGCNSRLRRKFRQLNRVAHVEFVLANEENFERLFEDFVHLHSVRWAARGEPGMLADPAIINFHRDTASAFMREGVLRLYVMEINGLAAAALYGFACQRRTFAYLSGFAPEALGWNAGALILGHAIRQAAREGCLEIDFLRGSEIYKYTWGALNRWNYCRRIIFDRSIAPGRAYDARTGS